MHTRELGALQPVRHGLLLYRLSHRCAAQGGALGPAAGRHCVMVTPTTELTIPWNSLAGGLGHRPEIRLDRPLQRSGTSARPCECLVVFGDPGPLRNGGRLDLHVELDAPGAGPDAQGLDGTVVVPGQHDRTLRGLEHCGPVPLEAEKHGRELSEHAVRPTFGGELDLDHADLRVLHRPDVPPRASASSWCPRQTPRKGRPRSATQRRMAAFSAPATDARPPARHPWAHPWPASLRRVQAEGSARLRRARPGACRARPRSAAGRASPGPRADDAGGRARARGGAPAWRSRQDVEVFLDVPVSDRADEALPFVSLVVEEHVQHFAGECRRG